MLKGVVIETLVQIWMLGVKCLFLCSDLKAKRDALFERRHEFESSLLYKLDIFIGASKWFVLDQTVARQVCDQGVYSKLLREIVA